MHDEEKCSTKIQVNFDIIGLSVLVSQGFEERRISLRMIDSTLRLRHIYWIGCN